jgi:eukaryotic-like serine/threonine-protein kinase
LGAALAATLFLNWSTKPAEEGPIRFQISLPVGTGNFTLSPNGRMLAIIASGPDGRYAIYKRDLDSLDTQMLPGTGSPIGPPVFWSPDSRFVVFQAGSTLKKVDVTGGPPQAICDVPAVVLGGDWNRDGVIILGTAAHGIMKVSASGGEPTYVTQTGGVNEIHAFPFFLPDGKHFLYLQAPRDAGIYVGTLDAKPEQQNPKVIVATNHMTVYAPSGNKGTGYLLFLRENTLLAQAFDERKLELFGDTYPITGEVGTFLESANIATSANGVLAFRAGKSANPVSGLEWYDRQGRVLGQVGEGGGDTPLYMDLALSPDGKKAATAQFNPRHGPIPGVWLHDLARGVSVPLTFDFAPDSSPAWSPDGNRVAYGANRKGGSGIFAKEANGSGKEIVLVEPTDDPKYPNGWSRDGRYLLYTENNPKTSGDLWALPLAPDGTPSGPPIPIAKTEFDEGQGQFSPDMHWIAYTSDVSGRPEIYVQPFPAPPAGAAKTLVSRGGGTQARWRRDEKELFYLSLDGKATAVEVSGGQAFKAGVPRPLFQVFTSSLASEYFSAIFRWDVTADGKKFLIDTMKPSTDPATVVLNWTNELKKK